MDTHKPCDIGRGAKILGVKTTTLRAWLTQRRIPYYKLGRRIVLDERDLANFLEANRVEAINTEALEVGI